MWEGEWGRWGEAGGRCGNVGVFFFVDGGPLEEAGGWGYGRERGRQGAEEKEDGGEARGGGKGVPSEGLYSGIMLRNGRP